jgi:hypothetical protein
MSRGLVMYDSLIETGIDFHLYVFAFDDLTFSSLKEINLNRATITSLNEFENKELLAVKSSRTKAEYCWTSTSSIIEYVLKHYNVPYCIYLDADLFFSRSPELLLAEFPDDKSVLITEHRYSRLAKILEGRRAGRFCVQFILFRNNDESRKILEKWIRQCINWCYARYENGKFGDQKYLDTWPEEYDSVHILQHRGGGIAPWNIRRYKLVEDGNELIFKENWQKEKFQLVFYHFHYVRFLCDGTVDLGWNRLPKKIINRMYIPYISRIIEKENYLRNCLSDYRTNYSTIDTHGMRNTIKNMIKRATGLNIIKSTVA